MTATTANMTASLKPFLKSATACFLATLLFISCKNDEPYDGLYDASVNAVWRLDTLAAVNKNTVIVNQDKGPFFAGKELTLSFNEDHTLSSRGYSYDLGGNYVIRENQVMQINARRENANQVMPSSQWETLLLYALNHSETYKVEGNRLFLYYEGGQWVAKFTKK